MAVNKNALIRYKTIDKCLQNRFRKWTLDDLIDACSDALYEYEGKDTYVSKRTVQLDIQNMRSDKLGYNAPIIVTDRKYYTYEDENYSITNLPISSNDLEKLAETVTLLKQFKGFSHFDELSAVVQKLEDHVYATQTHTKPVIEFEKNEHLKGLRFLDELYQAIIQKKSIEITYKSFKARQEATFFFNAYLLKEFRNRWFVIGIRKNQKHLVNLALDRIISLKTSDEPYQYNTQYNLDTYFSKSIGVTVNPNLQTEKIILFIYNKHAPYVLTKPFHSSQKLIKKDIFGITISLDVQHNFELEKEILGLGDGIRVVSPNTLKRRIRERLLFASESYQTEISEKGLQSMKRKLLHKGSAVLNVVFSKREIKKIKQQLHHYFKATDDTKLSIEQLLDKIPHFFTIIFNDNLSKIVQTLGADYQLTNSFYFKKIIPEIHKKEWFQKTESTHISIIIFLKEATKDTCFQQVILGSQNKFFNSKEKELIVRNSEPYDCFVREGGVQILNDWTLRKWQEKNKNQRFEMIELVYEKTLEENE